MSKLGSASVKWFEFSLRAQLDQMATALRVWLKVHGWELSKINFGLPTAQNKFWTPNTRLKESQIYFFSMDNGVQNLFWKPKISIPCTFNHTPALINTKVQNILIHRHSDSKSFLRGFPNKEWLFELATFPKTCRFSQSDTRATRHLELPY